MVKRIKNIFRKIGDGLSFAHTGELLPAEDKVRFLVGKKLSAIKADKK